MEVLDYASPVGNLRLTAEDGALVGLLRADPAGHSDDSPVLRLAAAQLDEYFAGTRRSFTVPLRVHGTAFQMAAWEALRAIPYGQTRSYSEQAASIGRPKATRAIGQANHRNPICILIPCHRVIGKSGALTGYAEGLDMKEYLLKLEQQND